MTQTATAAKTTKARKPAISETDALDAAIERATRAGVKVLATGRVKSSGQRFWIVSSVSDPDHPHLCFRLATGRLSCDCKAGRTATCRVCQHVAAVVMHETVQADRRRRQAEELEEAEREEQAEQAAQMAEIAKANATTRDELHALRERQAIWAREARERDAAPLLRTNAPISPFAAVAPRPVRTPLRPIPTLSGGGATPRVREQW